MINTETHEPVYIYVDRETRDTIYGATGDVVNGHVVEQVMANMILMMNTRSSMAIIKRKWMEMK